MFLTDDGVGFLRRHGWPAAILDFAGVRLGDFEVPAGAGETLVGTVR